MADWDVIVIGGGAAGLSAAAAAASQGLSTLLLDRMGGGGELMNLNALHDVPGAETGPDLMAQFQEAAMAAGAELGVAEVAVLAEDGDGWRVETDGAVHVARAVILAVGLSPGTLGLAEEARFEGMGLSHCAACDGPLFQGEPVIVAGAGRWAVAEALELASTASQVTLVTHGEPAPAAPDGVIVLAGRITALEGTPGLEAVVVQPDAGGVSQRLPAQAVFVQTGRRPALGFAPEALAHAPDGRLLVDAHLRCNLPGLFAAGDARAGAPGTLAAAMEDGRRAAAALSPLANPPDQV